jgi:hypothetical protein
MPLSQPADACLAFIAAQPNYRMLLSSCSSNHNGLVSSKAAVRRGGEFDENALVCGVMNRTTAVREEEDDRRIGCNGTESDTVGLILE